MTDHVYLVRPGANHRELRYSLRSLAANVEPGRVWLVGFVPQWVRNVVPLHRPTSGDKHATTTNHLRFLCQNDDVPDPFWLWMDDIYATRPVDLDVWHAGRPQLRGPHDRWHNGARATARWLISNGWPDPVSYELHLPLLVHKEPMLQALQVLSRIDAAAPHKRTLYGNIAGLGGTYRADVKIRSRVDVRHLKDSDWLSSADDTFRPLVQPLLGHLPPSRYES